MKKYLVFEKKSGRPVDRDFQPTNSDFGMAQFDTAAAATDFRRRSPRSRWAETEEREVWLSTLSCIVYRIKDAQKDSRELLVTIHVNSITTYLDMEEINILLDKYAIQYAMERSRLIGYSCPDITVE